MSSSRPPKPIVAIITPATAAANNGNWRTASRWQALIQNKFRPIVQSSWPLTPPQPVDILIALHARRSAEYIASYRQALPHAPLIVVLTGTDLYADLAKSVAARHSLDLADALIVLQEDAIQYLPREHRKKTHVIYQSAKTLVPAKKPRGKLNCVVVGHLRAEKDPEVIFKLAESLPLDTKIHITHIGAPNDATFAARAKTLSDRLPHYQWVGALDHGLTRAAIKRAHLLLHPSVLEGGANVIVEALSSGTPVLASEMSGNVGMLGRDYGGYFPVGDWSALQSQLEKCALDANYLLRLNNACAARSKLFLPATERDTLVKLITALLSR